MYFPRNWEFGSALSKLRNFGGVEHPNPPSPWYATGQLILIGGQKAWMEVLTNAVYRAVHLELITDLSTNGFLLSLCRFIPH
jgi:hypothetical protein